MKLESMDLGKVVAYKFTCDGQDVSPSLICTNFPKETKSFALSVVDPDVPNGNWIHWLVYNIPLSKAFISEGEVPGKEVMNDFGFKKYGGPCPPRRGGTHRYIFTMYALDVESIGIINNKVEFFKKVAEHTIAKAELISKYSRD